jgi:hypothetical protein
MNNWEELKRWVVDSIEYLDQLARTAENDIEHRRLNVKKNEFQNFHIKMVEIEKTNPECGLKK